MHITAFITDIGERVIPGLEFARVEDRSRRPPPAPSTRHHPEHPNSKINNMRFPPDRGGLHEPGGSSPRDLERWPLSGLLLSRNLCVHYSTECHVTKRGRRDLRRKAQRHAGRQPLKEDVHL